MKKLLTLISIVLMLGLFVNAWSAITEYTYSQGTGTYTAAVGMSYIASQDDANSGAINIGFDFAFDGATYNQFYANSNGFIRLGAYPSATYMTGVIGATANTQFLSPFNRDGATNTGGVVVELLGSAPNRVCKIEYPNWKVYFGSTATTLNMQILLAETTNTITYIYGSYVYGSAYSGQLGIRSSSVATDFVTRTTTTDWTATTSGASTSEMSLNSTVYPAVGQYYTWTPPVAGSAPNPANIVSPADGATGVSVASALNWSSGGGMPSDYDVYFGLTNPPALIGNQTGTSYSPAGMQFFTQYYWKIIPHNEFGYAEGCPVWSFTTGGPQINMTNGSVLVPAGTNYSFFDSGGPSATYQNNENYTFTFNVPTGYVVQTVFSAFSLEGWCDYLYAYDGPDASSTLIGSWDQTTPPTLTSTGTSMTFRFTSDSSVLYNGWEAVVSAYAATSAPNPAVLVSPADGGTNVLSTATLNWGSGGGVPTGYTLYFGTNNPPTNIVNGMDMGTTTTYDPNPDLSWNTTYYWQVIPYNDNGNATGCPVWSFSTPTTAPNAAAIVSPADAATGISGLATLNWADGGGIPTGYTLYFGTNNPPTNIANGVDMGTATTYDPNPNMAYSTTYYWQVVPYNPNGNASGCPVWSFTTMADPSISTFPYTQPFDVWPPAGWSLAGGTQNWAQYNTGSNYWAYTNYWSWSQGNTAYMTTPPITSADPINLSFVWSHAYLSSYPNDALTVQTSTDGTNWTDVWYKSLTDFNSGDGAGNTAPGTGVTENVLLGMAGQTFYLRFYGYSGYGPNLYIDNVTLTQMASGTPPDPVTMVSPVNGAVNIDPYTAILDWTPALTGSPATNYAVGIGVTDVVDDLFADGYAVDHPVSQFTPYTATPPYVMDFNTQYYWMIFPGNNDGTPDLEDCEIWSFRTKAQMQAPTTLNLGSVMPGGTKTGTIAVQNVGLTPLTFSAVGNDFAFTAPFEVPAQSTLDLPYTFTAPGIEGAYTGSILLTETAPGSSSITIDVTASIETNIVVGNGTTEFPLPVDPYWTYTYSQSIYLQNEIGANTQFTSVSYYYNGDQAWTEPNIDIYMGHTDRTAFASTSDWEPIANLTQVFTGGYSVPATAGWITFQLTTPFTYNNTQNLVIAVNENGGASNTYHYNTSFFFGEARTENRSIYSINDTAAYDPAAPAAGTLTLGIPNTKFAIQPISNDPIFAINPTTWNYGNVDLNDNMAKTFTVSNNGLGSYEVTTVTITGTDAASFALVSPPDLPWTIGATPVTFDVVFTPATVGEKIATLNVTDNLGRVLHEIPLTGTGRTEMMYTNVNLTGQIVAVNNVQLDWVPSYVDGFGSWVHWDSGENVDGIGTNSANTFDAAIKFTTANLAPYVGQNLTAIKFFPRYAASTYEVKVWTGNDVDMAPTTLIYSDPVTTFTANAWNQVPLAGGIPITGTEALYIGYNANTTGGHPLGCDAGPATAGISDLLYFQGVWVSMATQYSLNYNWNIQGYITPGAPTRTANLLNIPVIQGDPRTIRSTRLSTDPFSASHSTARSLQGYKVYRNGTLITPTPIMDVTYTDAGLADGDYSYYVVAQYVNGSVQSNTYVANIVAIAPYTLPFSEDWTSESFATQNWIASGNWMIESTVGLPAPMAYFNWSPAATDYDYTLQSFNATAVGYTSVKFRYDLAFSNYDTATLEQFATEVWTQATGWTQIDHFDNSVYTDGFDWMRRSHDISALVAGQVFKVRFRAYGEDSYNINYWLLDNILVDQLVAPGAPVITTNTFDGTVGTMEWTGSVNADYYAIYRSTDPYGSNWELYAVTADPVFTYDPADAMYFFKATAVAGQNPETLIRRVRN